MQIKILGMGHSMLGDDEVGLRIVQQWIKSHASAYPEDTVEAEILESPGITLLGEIAGRDAAILVDAVLSGARAGTLHKLTEEDLANFTDRTGSSHGWGATETLSLGHQLIPEDMPEKIYIIGVEALQFELGEGLSPAVKASIPRAVEMIEGILQEILKKDIWGVLKKLGDRFRRRKAFL